MATIYSLAPETLSHIFDLAHDPHKPSTMKSASLVCRAWRDPAQRALFLDIVIIPGAFKALKKYIWIFSELELSPRLLTPRRVEVLASSMMSTRRVDASGDLFRGLSGVRNLVVTGGLISPGFLNDLKLSEIERLALYQNIWEQDDFHDRFGHLGLPLPPWPVHLRALRMDSRWLKRLLRAYRPPTNLISLTLQVDWLKKRILGGPPFKVADIPPSVLDLSIILTVPNSTVEALPFFTGVQHLHHLTLVFGSFQIFPPSVRPSLVPSFIKALVGSLPSSIERLELKNIGCAGGCSTFPLFQTPFVEILQLFSDGNLPKLARLDFPDCKRKDLNEAAAATDLLAECKRRSIRVGCWEDLI